MPVTDKMRANTGCTAWQPSESKKLLPYKMPLHGMLFPSEIYENNEGRLGFFGLSGGAVYSLGKGFGVCVDAFDC